MTAIAGIDVKGIGMTFGTCGAVILDDRETGMMVASRNPRIGLMAFRAVIAEGRMISGFGCDMTLIAFDPRGCLLVREPLDRKAGGYPERGYDGRQSGYQIG
jgi:hypothetical protein